MRLILMKAITIPPPAQALCITTALISEATIPPMAASHCITIMAIIIQLLAMPLYIIMGRAMTIQLLAILLYIITRQTIIRLMEKHLCLKIQQVFQTPPTVIRHYIKIQQVVLMLPPETLPYILTRQVTA